MLKIRDSLTEYAKQLSEQMAINVNGHLKVDEDDDDEKDSKTCVRFVFEAISYFDGSRRSAPTTHSVA